MARLRPALEIFVWSRAAIWITTLIAYLVLQGRYTQPLHPPTEAPPTPHDTGWAFDLWARWDGGWFTHIADDGYTDRKSTPAFFPAYPLTVRVVGWIFGGHFVIAGVLVSLLACAAAFALLYELARGLAGEEAA